MRNSNGVLTFVLKLEFIHISVVKEYNSPETCPKYETRKAFPYPCEVYCEGTLYFTAALIELVRPPAGSSRICRACWQRSGHFARISTSCVQRFRLEYPPGRGLEGLAGIFPGQSLWKNLIVITTPNNPLNKPHYPQQQ